MKILIIHEKPKARRAKRGQKRKSSHNYTRDVIIVSLIILAGIALLVLAMMQVAGEGGIDHERAVTALETLRHLDRAVPVLARGLAAVVLAHQPPA